LELTKTIPNIRNNKRLFGAVMQNGLTQWWLTLPIPALFFSLFTFYIGAAVFIVWLSFRSRFSGRIQSFKGVVAPFFGSTATIFALLIGFLSNDIWERNQQAQRIVLAERDTLLALYSLSMASGSDDESMRSAIRGYAQAVIEYEWRRLRVQERSPEADAALDALLREVATRGGSKNMGVQRTMLDMVLNVRIAHEERVVLSNERTVGTKWAVVLLLALLTQVAISVVHLDRPRPQFAALFIFTLAAVSVLGLLAAHEAPFQPPLFVPPGPIADVLRQVPR
jgi:hypothetical protein